MSKLTHEGKEQIIHVLSVGDFFGELSLFSDSYYTSFFASAVSDVQLCVVSKENMDKVLSKNPQITLKLLNEVSKKLMETENLATCLATNDVDHRIVCTISEFVEKYGVDKDGSIEVELPLNREGLANYCGITRETMSRKLSKFEQDGLFELKGVRKLIVKDFNKLKNFLE